MTQHNHHTCCLAMSGRSRGSYGCTERTIKESGNPLMVFPLLGMPLVEHLLIADIQAVSLTSGYYELALGFSVTCLVIASGNRGLYAIFWSSAAYGESNAWKRNFNNANAGVNRNANNRSNGNSVRCVRDSSEWQKQQVFFKLKMES